MATVRLYSCARMCWAIIARLVRASTSVPVAALSLPGNASHIHASVNKHHYQTTACVVMVFISRADSRTYSCRRTPLSSTSVASVDSGNATPCVPSVLIWMLGLNFWGCCDVDYEATVEGVAAITRLPL